MSATMRARAAKRRRELVRRAEAAPEQRDATGLSMAKLAEILGGHSQTDAGVSVTEQNALRFATVMACVRILSESIGVLPLNVYERLPGGGRQRARGHPVHRLVHDEPNSGMTAAVWKETLQGHLCTAGNAYSRIMFAHTGQVGELIPWTPDQVEHAKTRAGKPVIVFYENGQPSVALDLDEVLHIPALGFDGRVGYSPIGYMRQTVGIGMGLEKFSGSALANGAWMAHVIETDGELEEETFKRLKAELKAKKGGVANALHPTILEAGMKLRQLALPGDDAMFLELRKYTKREIASLYRIPPHMLADMEKGASFASIEQASIEFVRYSLSGWLTKWAQELTRKLVFAKRRFYVEFNPDAFLAGDTKARLEAYKVALEAGIYSLNEVRERENLTPVENGDKHRIPLNMGIVEDGAKGDGGQDEPAADPPEDRAAVMRRSVRDSGRQLLESASGRLTAKACDRLVRLEKKPPAVFRSLVEKFFAEHRGHALSVLEEGAQFVAIALFDDSVRAVPQARAAVRMAVDGAHESAARSLITAHEAGGLGAALTQMKADCVLVVDAIEQELVNARRAA